MKGSGEPTQVHLAKREMRADAGHQLPYIAALFMYVRRCWHSPPWCPSENVLSLSRKDGLSERNSSPFSPMV